jgi:hypothetical protein
VQTKLTLRLDDRLIERAKIWASARDVSLSELVARFFAELADLRAEPGTEGLSESTRRLIGVAAPDGAAPTDAQLRDEYLAHAEEKHR